MTNLWQRCNSALGPPTTTVDKEKYDHCLKDLFVTNPTDDKTRIEEVKGGLLEGTHEWIFTDQAFCRWSTSDASLLCIEGGPGKGKTMLSISIIDQLETRVRQLQKGKHDDFWSNPQDSILLYFFCQATDLHLNNVTSVFRSLMHQLVWKRPPLSSDLVREYQVAGDKLFRDGNAPTALSRLLSNMLRDNGLKRVYIVVDALDECETGLPKLLKLITDNSSDHRVKWVVASRKSEVITKGLEAASPIILNMEEPATVVHISNAVKLFIDTRISGLPISRYGTATRDRLRNILHQRAEDTFLWVAIVWRELEGAVNVIEVAEGMPKGLGKLYDRAMGRLEGLGRSDSDFCRRVLSTATLAYRPIHISEIGLLAGLPDDISSNMEMVREIVNRCGSLLLVRKDRVYIIHQSAKTYLAESPALGASNMKTHHIIFKGAIEGMRKHLRRDIYGLSPNAIISDGIPTPDSDPLLPVKYSCAHWVDHLQQSQDSCDLKDGGDVHNFLESHLLLWIEAVSLSGEPHLLWVGMSRLERMLRVSKPFKKQH